MQKGNKPGRFSGLGPVLGMVVVCRVVVIQGWRISCSFLLWEPAGDHVQRARLTCIDQSADEAL